MESIAGIWYKATRKDDNVGDYSLRIWRWNEKEVATLPSGTHWHTVQTRNTKERFVLIRDNQLDSKSLRRLGLVNTPQESS